MTKFLSYVILTLATLCSVTHAAQIKTPPVIPYSLLPHGWLLNIDGGAAWPYVHKDLYVRNGASIASGLGLDHFTGNSPTNGMIGAMAAYKWVWGCSWFPGISLGVRYQHFFSDSVQGYIDQFGLIMFRNYQYSFDISADLISLYSKLDIFYVDKFFFYIDGGVGAAFNHAGNFSETALPGVIPRISPAWGPHDQTNVAYTIGAGLDYLLTQQLTLNVGYDYQNLGRMHTGNGVGAWSGTVLGIGDYKANTIFGGLTYFFDRVVRGYEK